MWSSSGWTPLGALRQRYPRPADVGSDFATTMDAALRTGTGEYVHGPVRTTLRAGEQAWVAKVSLPGRSVRQRVTTLIDRRDSFSYRFTVAFEQSTDAVLITPSRVWDGWLQWFVEGIVCGAACLGFAAFEVFRSPSTAGFVAAGGCLVLGTYGWNWLALMRSRRQTVLMQRDVVAAGVWALYAQAADASAPARSADRTGRIQPAEQEQDARVTWLKADNKILRRASSFAAAELDARSR
jgi:hypothetical protein